MRIGSAMERAWARRRMGNGVGQGNGVARFQCGTGHAIRASTPPQTQLDRTMPTYEYKREDGTVFEIEQRITDSPLTECPTTGQKVKRLISGGAGLVFKGSGFYLTDYARKSSSLPSTSSSEPSGTSSASASTSADSSKKD